MKAAIAVLLALCAAATTGLVPIKRQGETEAPKVILDNDWGPTDFILVLMALASPYQILGLTSNTANSWALQCSLHALRSLQLGGLENCIPVHKGTDYPLLNTADLQQSWEYIHGALPWSGAFAPMNMTAEAAGSDPTDGNPNRIVPSAFVDGKAPDLNQLNGTMAAAFMVDMVREYPGEVSIYAAGSFTNIALAIRLDPTFAQNAKELVFMGGYIDTNLLMVTGSANEADINSDINIKIDPEAAKIVLTADWQNITLVGNAANSVFLNQTDLEEIYNVNNSFSQAMMQYFQAYFPLWDATALAVMLEPETVVTNSTDFFVDVDVAWYSPYYGNVRASQQMYAPKGQTLRSVRYPFAVDVERVKELVRDAVMQPGSCEDN
ncbi:hypothetical protein OHC33_007030 [Knufia fluminis]|uniref:Inosine/uridine-preferring nucleoside hydrolase domain-containing protein n=1 Tax=Knufia fluminis TaxID=191047 RepID=A0AAN8EC63_9EURO|nr:hypothetical protein OHC33_007030 [Knufia fluminis]